MEKKNRHSLNKTTHILLEEEEKVSDDTDDLSDPINILHFQQELVA